MVGGTCCGRFHLYRTNNHYYPTSGLGGLKFAEPLGSRVSEHVA